MIPVAHSTRGSRRRQLLTGATEGTSEPGADQRNPTSTGYSSLGAEHGPTDESHATGTPSGPTASEPQSRAADALLARHVQACLLTSSPASPTGPNSGVRNLPTPLATRPRISHAAPNIEAAPTPTDNASMRTAVPRPAPRSARTTSSRRNLAILKARDEAAQARLALLEGEEAASLISEEDDQQSRVQRVDSWVEDQQRMAASRDQSPPRANLCEPMPRSDLAEIATAIVNATHTSTRAIVEAMQPALRSRQYSDLPPFFGADSEWLRFRVAYNETEANFTAKENTARLRRALKDNALKVVESLLLHTTTPELIMQRLERHFGKPRNIAIAQMGALRALPRLADNPRDICAFACKVSNAVAVMRALDREAYLNNPELAVNLAEKLPPTLQHRWYDVAATYANAEPDLLAFADFMERQAELCSPFAQSENMSTSNKHNNTPNVRRRNIQRAYNAAEEAPPTPSCADSNHVEKRQDTKPCEHCKSTSHDVTTCDDFKRLGVNERWEAAKKHRLCFRCLRFRAKTHHCKFRKCNIDECKYPHHQLLHKQRTPENEQSAECVASTWTPHIPAAYLKMAPVRVCGPSGEVEAWALLDDGSTVSLIDDKLADQVGARGPVDPLYINAIGNKKLDSSRSRRVSLTIRGRDSEPQQLRLRTINDLRLTPQQIRKVEIDGCPHLEELTARLPIGIARPQLLIGQDNWPLLTVTEVRCGHRDQPVASLTPLGWVLHGVNPRAEGHQHGTVNHLTESAPEDEVNEALRRYFAVDNLTVEPKKPQSDPEQRALTIMRATTTQQPDGRYETGLLWKSEHPNMPNNRETALTRLRNIEKKVAKNTLLQQKYKTEMNGLLEKGYAEYAPTRTTPGKTWYLPHFGVTSPMKPDKLRIVHDAAAKTQGCSLNSFLLTGPDQLQSLPGVLMRFRQHAVAVSADITEMFMRVQIRQEDRDALRYLWRDNPEDPPTEFRMKSLIFGATCSPASAIFVKNLNAEKFRDRHPEAVDAIVRNHYMDDYLGSYKSPEEAAQIAGQVRDIHASGGFHLRKWNSNSEAVRRQLTNEDAPVKVTLAAGAVSERVLGLVWKPECDTLGFNMEMARVPTEILNCESPTKREALRIVMSIYDPLGLASVITVQAKQLLQELWRRGTDWDTPIDKDLALRWRAWMGHLRQLRHVTVPRPYAGYTDAINLQLHTFVDASETAYAAALYWRALLPDGRVTLSLVLGKARVAPLKLSSIPRLELQAAVTGSRMAAAVTEEHDRKPNERYFWTDSMTALAWIKNGARAYKPYVAHRIAAVEDNSDPNEWRWVPTKLNVADDGTRDVPENFDGEHRWFRGPAFLLGSEDTWPTQPNDFSSVVATNEEKCNTIAETPSLREALPDISRFSKWERYLRTTARVVQFTSLCRKKRENVNYKRTRANAERDPAYNTKGKRKNADTPVIRDSTPVIGHNTPIRYRRELDGDTLRRAETLIWRLSQEEAFARELNALRCNEEIAKDSRLRPLSVVLNEDGLICLNSRIRAATDVPPEQKSPPVLDGNRPEVKLLIDFIHRRAHHSGVEATIAECRTRYWVLRLRPTTKMILHRCIRCRLRRDVPPRPATGDHPACRLAHHRRPFSFVGLDFFGPQSVTVGRAIQKHYGVIFSCLTTRSIHLEPAASLSTSSAVMALRRMIARRGVPTEIWSDNGTNLCGADRELREAIDRTLEGEASSRAITWRRIPPGSPFMGGSWERMVRSVKTALAATEQQRHPTPEVYHTLLAEAEFTVNSRPLTHVSVSHEDMDPLTPNHFLLGGPARNPAPGHFDDNDLIGRAHWRASQRLADVFWDRWVREYLPELQNRRDPHSRGPPVNIGDLVVIADNTQPRNTWPRGRVEATYPGADGVTRVVDVRTASGTTRRPVKKLVKILPVAHQE